MRRTGASGDCHDVHRRNLTSVASPVILMFDGFHNLVYHIYLATRWGPGISSLYDYHIVSCCRYLLSMALLLLRLAVAEIVKSSDGRKSLNKGIT